MELWDLYNSDREKTDKYMVRGDVLPIGYYRLVVHACVFNSEGQMLIQQRQPFKSGWSNLWDVTCGGSAIIGETSQMAVHRELLEELGIDYDFSDTRAKFTVNFDDGFDDFYIITKDVDISDLKLQYEEVKAVRWASCSDICNMIDSGEFIPYFLCFIQTLFNMKNQYGEINENSDTYANERNKDGFDI